MIEKHITSFENSRRLYKIGFKKDSFFHWISYDDDPEKDYYDDEYHDRDLEKYGWTLSSTHCSRFNSMKHNYEYAAYTASELMEIIPTGVHDGFDCYYLISKSVENPILDRGYIISYETFDGKRHEKFKVSEDESLSNALAKMLIYLIENKLVEVK